MRTIKIYFRRKLYCSNFGYITRDQILDLIKLEDIRFIKTKPFAKEEDSFFLADRNFDPEEDVTFSYLRKLLLYKYEKKIARMGSEEALKKIREI